MEFSEINCGECPHKGSYEKPWTDRNGITFIGIMPFLLDLKSLETL